MHIKTQLSWVQQRRLAFIDFWCWKTGTINRSQIANHFQVTYAVASVSIAEYRRRFPRNIVYDTQRKAYVATSEFKPGIIDTERLKPPYCPICWGEHVQAQT